MSAVNLRNLELIVDRMHLLCADESANNNRTAAASDSDRKNAVKMLVETACQGTIFKFSKLINPVAVFQGYEYHISYFVKATNRTHNTWLKLTTITHGVELEFLRDNWETMFAFIPDERNDAEQIEALKEFASKTFRYTNGEAYKLQKAPRELEKQP